MRTMPSLSGLLAAAVLVLLLPPPASPAGEAEPFDDAGAFDQLKQLAGDWTGTYGDGAGELRLAVTSAGHTVEQTEFPGTSHEMRTFYFLDGGALVAQHYCVLGNQPRYRFEPSPEAGVIRFRFDGGTNLDPDRDPHSHNGYLRLHADGRLESVWTFFEGGKPSNTATFELERAAASTAERPRTP